MQSTKTKAAFDHLSRCDSTLMLFDLSIYGHHPSYIQYLIAHWRDRQLPGRLEIVVSPPFSSEHADVVEFAAQCDRVGVRAISNAEHAQLAPRTNGWTRAKRAFQEWELFCQYARSVQATQGLLMYFDTAQYPLALKRPSPCPFSAIYFRPSFHYERCFDYSLSWKERLQQIREKVILDRVLAHRKLQTLFCLDPFAIEAIDRINSDKNAVHLPDPVPVNCQISTDLNALRQRLEIEPYRRIFLMFGALTGRKGIYQLLEAIAQLSPQQCQKLCVLFVGEANPRDRDRIERKIQTLCETKPIQIVRHYEFVPDDDVPAYFQLADVALAPYQKHVGMSGIVQFSAATQTPVLSSDYGLMGELVRRYRLGLAVDTTVPQHLSRGIGQLLQGDLSQWCDRAKMQQFAQQNSIERFTETIFRHLCPSAELPTAVYR
jgi:glycosyltransferase involved in cell wall biosynthesis